MLPRDEERCAALLRASFLASFGDGSLWEKTFGVDGQRFFEWLRAYRGEALHAWADGELAGEIMFDVRRAHLHHLHVVPRHRGSGLASLLHDRFLDAAGGARSPLAIATLKVSRTNLRAIRFYRKHGWRFLSFDGQDPKLDVYALRLPVGQRR